MTHHTDAERAEFEAWARNQYPSIDLTSDGNDYSKALAKDYWSLWQAARRAPAAPVPKDPMDWPLPCDVTVGGGTMHKGVKLRTLVLRMKVLYKMATGNDADEVEARTVGERKKLLEGFLAQIAAAPRPPEAEPVQLPEPRWHSPSPCDAAHFPYYTPEDVSKLLAQHGIK